MMTCASYGHEEKDRIISIYTAHELIKSFNLKEQEFHEHHEKAYSYYLELLKKEEGKIKWKMI